MALNSHFLNLHNTSGAVGTKDKTDDLRNEVIILLAFSRILELPAISTGGVAMFQTADPNLAPGSFVVVMTAGASISQVKSARTEVKTAVCYQFHV